MFLKTADRGFEYFYGFVGGEANQYYPGIFENTVAVEPPKTPEQERRRVERTIPMAYSASAWPWPTSERFGGRRFFDVAWAPERFVNKLFLMFPDA